MASASGMCWLPCRWYSVRWQSRHRQSRWRLELWPLKVYHHALKFYLEIVGRPFDWLQDNTISGWYSIDIVLRQWDKYILDYTVLEAQVQSDRALGSWALFDRNHLYRCSTVNDMVLRFLFFDISYIGEQWRDGGNTTQHKLSFSYRVDSSITDLVTGVWTKLRTHRFHRSNCYLCCAHWMETIQPNGWLFLTGFQQLSRLAMKSCCVGLI